MSTIYLKRSDKTVDEIIRAAFPGFTGQNVQARIAVSTRLYGTNWDEGCKRDYVFVRLADCQVMPVPTAPYMESSTMHDNLIEIPEGLVCVARVRSQGREYIEIISPVTNIAPLLPAPVELTDDERIVLVATKSLKASYGGISDFRFREAQRYRGINRAQWDAAKASLIARKLLNKAGAISVEGRNLVANDRLETY